MDPSPDGLQLLIDDRWVRGKGGLLGGAVAVHLDASDGRRGCSFEHVAHSSHFGLQVSESLFALLLVLFSEVALP